MNRILCFSLFCFLYADTNAQKYAYRPGVELPDETDLSTIAPAYARVMQMSERKAAPKIVDLSPLLPPVGDQKRQNSCVGWALGYAYRSFYNAEDSTAFTKKNKTTDYSKIISPAFIYNLLNNGDAGRGIKMEKALRLMQDIGSCTYESMPYSERGWTQQPQHKQFEEAQNFKIETFSMIDRSYLVYEIKGQLRSNQPVLISAFFDQHYFDRGHNYKEGFRYVWDTLRKNDPPSGHAMLIVGYSDFEEAFKFMNSYGNKWGNRGFGWLSYKIAPEAIRVAYVIKPNRKLKQVFYNICETDTQGTLEYKMPKEPRKGLKQEEPVQTKSVKKPDIPAKKSTSKPQATQQKFPKDSKPGSPPEESMKKSQAKTVKRPSSKPNPKFQEIPGDTITKEEQNRKDSFTVTLEPINQFDSSYYDIALTMDIKDCKCDSYQIVVQFFFADFPDYTKKAGPVQSYNPQYSLANDQAAIICDKQEFRGETNQWKRIRIPLDKIAIPKGVNTSQGYLPARTKLIAEAVWYNDDYPVRSFGTIPIEVKY